MQVQKLNLFWISRYEVIGKQGSICTISKYDCNNKSYWQIKYNNGKRKNFDKYQHCIDYLTSKGW